MIGALEPRKDHPQAKLIKPNYEPCSNRLRYKTETKGSATVHDLTEPWKRCEVGPGCAFVAGNHETHVFVLAHMLET